MIRRIPTLLSVAGLLTSCSGHALVGPPPEGGPLAFSKDAPRTLTTLEKQSGLRVGHAFSFGQLFVTNTGRAPAVIDWIGLTGRDPALTVRRTFVVLETKDVQGRLWGAAPRFPPAPLYRGRLLRPPAAVPGGAEAQILFELSVDTPGRHGAEGVLLRYHLGPRRFEAQYPEAVAADPRP